MNATSPVQLWKPLLKSWTARISVFIIATMVLMALLADILANEKPLYCSYQGNHYFPGLSSLPNFSLHDAKGEVEQTLVFSEVDWHKLPLQSVVWAPIPFGPEYVDKANRVKISPFAPQYYRNAEGEKIAAPFRFRHHLGTDEQGKDLLSRLIHGTRVSLSIGFLAVGIAAIIGILLGAIAAFFGDHKLKISASSLVALIPALVLAYFYGVNVRYYEWQAAADKGLGVSIGQVCMSLLIASAILAFFIGLGYLASQWGWGRRRFSLPIDMLISRSIELLESLPLILLLLTLAAIFKSDLYLIAIIIGLTGWTPIARFVRAEVLRITHLEYIQAARAMGFSNRRMILRHTIPNALTPIWIVLAFGIGGAIMAEAALSFIGIGIPEDVVSWGKLLPKKPLEAWWLALFPGLAIFVTVLSVNILGEKMRDIIDPLYHEG